MIDPFFPGIVTFDPKNAMLAYTVPEKK